MLDALGRRYGLIADFRLPSADWKCDHSAEFILTIGRYNRQSKIGNRQLERPKDTSSPVIAVDHQACILCDRCIRACDDIQCNEVIGRTGKGYATRIGFDLDNPMGESTCVSCGECVAACPTGALTNKTITLPLVPREPDRRPSKASARTAASAAR